MNRLGSLLGILAASLLANVAHAEVEIRVEFLGPEFSDPTPVAPVGGNPGTTLGAQRRLMMEEAAALWSTQLDSVVPILVQAFFTDLGCTEQGAVVASASARDMLQLPSASSSSLDPWYHSALANRLAGVDLEPTQADVTIRLNAAFDGSCRSQLGGFYYGFDGHFGDQLDILDTALHELAHGLGFSSYIDATTGQSVLPGLDVFSSHLHDTTLGKDWSAMTPTQRAASATRPRGLVWNGARTQAQTSVYLEPGTPTLSFEPAVAGYSGGASAVGFAANASLAPVRAPLVTVNPVDGCAADVDDVAGKVVLLDRSVQRCSGSSVVASLEQAGAAAIVLILKSSSDAPAPPLPDLGPKSLLPIMTLSVADGVRVLNAVAKGSVTASLAGDAKQLLGADKLGRPLMFTPSPYRQGSSVSHFDSSASPDTLMEPFTSDARLTHDLDLTRAIFQDMGWTPLCGNGQLDGQEQCDEGMANSDLQTGTCRTSCLRAGCGDGLVNDGEVCDDGRKNNDQAPDACRTTCQRPRCGDGILDSNELCDQGPRNNDVFADACRTNCRAAYCGDGVTDQGEECDGARDCSTTCVLETELDAPDGKTDPAFPAWTPPPEAPARRRDDGCNVTHTARAADAISWLPLLLLSLLARRPKRTARSASAHEQRDTTGA